MYLHDFSLNDLGFFLLFVKVCCKDMKKGKNPNTALELIVNNRMIYFIELAYSFTLSIEHFEKKSTN